MDIIILLKNITLSAEEKLIKKARERAQREHTTLNASFREWLKKYINSPLKEEDYDEIMKTLKYVRAGKKFSREEMNER